MSERRYISEIKMMHWVIFGTYYGYPKCCMEDFCTRGYDITPEQDKVHKHLGFVPCPKCSKKIVNGKTTIRELIKNRICDKEFPKDNIK